MAGAVVSVFGQVFLIVLLIFRKYTDGNRDNRSYSTNEINTGKKWVTGKDIYRKVFTTITTSANQTITLSLRNVNLINIYGVFKNGNNVFPIPYTYIDANRDYYEIYTYYDGSSTIYVVFGTSIAGYFPANSPMTLVVEYTK